MQLTEQQSQVLDSLTSFIISEDQQYMVLKGLAGTGKTTVVAELIQWIKQYNELAKEILIDNKLYLTANIPIKAEKNFNIPPKYDKN